MSHEHVDGLRHIPPLDTVRVNVKAERNRAIQARPEYTQRKLFAKLPVYFYCREHK